MNTKIFTYDPTSESFIYLANIGRMLDSRMYSCQFFKGSFCYETYTGSFSFGDILKIPVKNLIFRDEIKDTRKFHFSFIGFNFSILSDWTIRFEKKYNEIWINDLEFLTEIPYDITSYLA